MHRVARHTRTDPITFEVISHTLDRRYRLQTRDRSVFEALCYVDCTPDIDGPAPLEHVIAVEPHRSRFCVVEDGVVLREVLNGEGALDFLHKHLFAASLGARPDATVLHAACLRRYGRRLLLVGSKGAGKTTLTLRLMTAGFEIEGDEHVFIEPSGVTARPRGCRVREVALRQLSDIADVISAQPHFFESWSGERIFNCDPRVFGSCWRIGQGRVDLIIILRPNHGGNSSIRPMRPAALVPALMSETGWLETGRASSVGKIAALASSTPAFDLSLGDHPGALRCIEAVIRDS